MACGNSNCTELFLCIVFGFIGAHKFYTGNWKCGLFYVFTGGFALIGVCIDIFLILYFWKEEEEEIKIANELKGKKGNMNKEKLLLYSSANDSIINYKYTSNKGKTACASASGICLWISLIIIISLIIFFVYPFIDNNYFNEVYSSMHYESYYAKLFPKRPLSDFELTVENKERKKKYNRIKLFYPSDLEGQDPKDYPVILISNPLGVPYNKYESVFKHLASFGFITVGNDGVGGEDSNLPDIIDELNILNINSTKTNKFYNKLNLNEIGVIGYYQGSIQVVNLLTNFPYNNSIAAAYVSCLREYDLDESTLLEKIQNINIPFFQTAPGKGDTYNKIIKKIAQSFNKEVEIYSYLRREKEEGNMIIYGDAYMTAWFDYKLRRNDTLGESIFGIEGEMMSNANWTSIDR